MEWWTQAQSGLAFGLLGGAFGMLGAIGGTVIGVFGPRGRLKPVSYAVHIIGAGVGLAALVTGLVALVSRQPYHVWYPCLLLGVIGTGVCGGLFPVTRTTYRAAEHRMLEAEELRRA